MTLTDWLKIAPEMLRKAAVSALMYLVVAILSLMAWVLTLGKSKAEQAAIRDEGFDPDDLVLHLMNRKQ